MFKSHKKKYAEFERANNKNVQLWKQLVRKDKWVTPPGHADAFTEDWAATKLSVEVQLEAEFNKLDGEFTLLRPSLCYLLLSVVECLE